jgi:alkylated DNA repair dioxygenase AlkB
LAQSQRGIQPLEDRGAEADLVPMARTSLQPDFFAAETLPHGFFGNRRIVSYGWRYDYAGRALKESDPMPDFLLPLRDAAGRFAGLPAESFQQALVTEYAPGAGIGWHRDKPMFEDVVAFSLLAPCTLRLRHKDDGGWIRRSQLVAPRSAYLLRGPARFAWEHSIPPLTALRYSITFRTFRPEAQPD